MRLLVTLRVTQIVGIINLFMGELTEARNFRRERCPSAAAHEPELVCLSWEAPRPAGVLSSPGRADLFHICYFLSTCCVLRP